MLTQQAAEEHDGGSSTDQACTGRHAAHRIHAGLLAQLSQQLAALQKWQAQAASAADVRILDKQGASLRECSYPPRYLVRWSCQF